MYRFLVMFFSSSLVSGTTSAVRLYSQTCKPFSVIFRRLSPVRVLLQCVCIRRLVCRLVYFFVACFRFYCVGSSHALGTSQREPDVDRE